MRTFLSLSEYIIKVILYYKPQGNEINKIIIIIKKHALVLKQLQYQNDNEIQEQRQWLYFKYTL